MKKNFKMIMELAKNDFAMKYATNYMGVFWAFVQPIVTVAIYVFVFQYAFKASPSSNGYPYVLWLISGIVPWFYFAEAWLSGGNAFVEYSYLVKKVVFDIKILPIVKIISSLVIHVFFVVFALLLFVLLGYTPDIKFIQIIYYMVCLIVNTACLAYLTASIIPFFRDFYQIVNVISMIGMWITPIMWNYDDMSQNMGQLALILKLNPMFYVVKGYRDTFMGGEWFWQNPWTIYFWIINTIMLLVAVMSYKKMKIHFADVL